MAECFGVGIVGAGVGDTGDVGIVGAVVGGAANICWNFMLRISKSATAPPVAAVNPM